MGTADHHPEPHNPGFHHPEFATGRARYVADVAPADALVAAMVRSPVPHGRLRRVDASRALALSGVVAVLSADDLDEMPLIPIRSFSTPELEGMRQPVLARGVLRYLGEPVAVVVGVDRARAEEAARLVEVEIDPLEPVFDTSVAPEIARIVACDGNAEAVFAGASRVVERSLSSDRHTGLPLETRGLVARWDGGVLELWGPSKFVDHTVATVADWMGIDSDRVRLHPVAVGGMFGVRGELYPEDFLVPWAARRLGRPVVWTEDRVEHLAATNHAPAMEATVAIALGADDRLRGLRACIRLDMGAYPRGNGNRLAMLAIEELVGPYAWEAIDVVAIGVRTSATPTGSVRAPVASEATFFRESTIEAVARTAGLSSWDVRRRSVIAPEQLPFERRYGPGLHPQVYDGGDYPALFDTVAPTARWHEQEVRARRRGGEIAGSGMAVFLAHSGVAADETVSLDLVHGRIVAHTSLSEVGQGVDKIVRDSAADALGIDAECIEVRSGTPAPHGPGGGTFSSRSTVVGSHAARLAACALVEDVTGLLAVRDGCAPDEVAHVRGGFRSPARMTLWSELPWQVRSSGRFHDPEPLLGVGAHLARVVIDPITGRVEVEELEVAYDCGRALDPDGVRGQLAGGMAHGLGVALTESLGDARGSATARSLLQYRLPTVADVPKLTVRIIEGGTGRNPLGVKGAGEAGVIGVPAAVANAVADALASLGVDVYPSSIPLREQWVRGVIREAL